MSNEKRSSAFVLNNEKTHSMKQLQMTLFKISTDNLNDVFHGMQHIDNHYHYNISIILYLLS